VKKFADLHIHTYFSDSTLSPQRVIETAKERGLSCVGIADHDTVKGIKPTLEAAKGMGIEVIPGIELSSQIDDKDVHMLGYLIDYDSEDLNRILVRIQETRIKRIKKIINKLKEQGINNISAEEVYNLSRSDAVGRPHLARILIQKGWVSSIAEAFDRYLADGKSAFVRKFKMSPYEAIGLIEKAGGVAVLAHPMVSQVDELIPEFAKAGLRGLEVFYPNCSKTVMEYYRAIAEKYGLILTGGSDAHGDAKRNTFLGKTKISYDYVERLKKMKNNV